MTVKELITQLLEYPMDAEVGFSINVAETDDVVSSYKDGDIQIYEDCSDKYWVPLVVKIYSCGDYDKDE